MTFMLIAILFHPLWCWLFCVKQELGITGIGLTGIITNGAVLFSNITYSSYLENVREAIMLPDWRVFENIEPIL